VAVAAHDDEASLHERIKIAERELYPTVIANALATLASGGEITAVR
jgi:folate-dependent phosphoribosylglycinamide formyltransferase PurN